MNNTGMNSTAHGEHDSHPADSVVVDCDRCLVRGPSACGDCVVTFLLGAPPAGIEIDADEMAALGVLSEAGLTPPLRLVTPVAGPETQAV
ncbi:hypothetical protein [Aeromicrobium fastidiosum]|nr:hypothetical protein [Aeromicrobium fastidiosum]MBP2392366.1 hypothetical protein [Aeromicrobium fastidiosum]